MIGAYEWCSLFSKKIVGNLFFNLIKVECLFDDLKKTEVFCSRFSKCMIQNERTFQKIATKKSLFKQKCC